ncbi:suppressor of cytokine signaling 2 isoform 1-T1 [Dama dama]
MGREAGSEGGAYVWEVARTHRSRDGRLTPVSPRPPRLAGPGLPLKHEPPRPPPLALRGPRTARAGAPGARPQGRLRLQLGRRRSSGRRQRTPDASAAERRASHRLGHLVPKLKSQQGKLGRTPLLPGPSRLPRPVRAGGCLVWRRPRRSRPRRTVRERACGGLGHRCPGTRGGRTCSAPSSPPPPPFRGPLREWFWGSH